MKKNKSKTQHRKWKAKWIWAETQDQESNVYYYFRKTFKLPFQSKGHRLFISSDTRYQLFINGKFIGRGTPQSQPFFQYYDQYDVHNQLKKGKNCIAVIVNQVGNMTDTRGGLLLELVNDRKNMTVCTDKTWNVMRADAWQQDTYAVRSNKATPYQEFFDATKQPEGWLEVNFDDSKWSTAIIINGRISDRPPAAGPWSKLIARDIPFMTDDPVLPIKIERVEENLDIVNRPKATDLSPVLSMVGNPIQFSRLENPENLCSEQGTTLVQNSLNHHNLDFDGIYAPAVVLDFGRVITARIRLQLTGVSEGFVDIGYAERLIDGYFNNALECEFADRYIMKDGKQTFESFNWKSFRYLKLRFRSCFKPVKIHTVQGVVSTYPYKERGHFSSNNQTLNAVFDICRYTIRLCSNEFLMDTPWREQAQWLGDVALVTVPAIHSCFGDTALPRKFFMQAGQNQHPTGMISNISNTVNHGWAGTIPDYSLHWIQGLLTHYLYTGDEELLHRLYPQTLRILDAHLDYLNDASLIEDMPYWVFIDWADVERRGICSAYNSIFYETLKCLHKLATFKEDKYTAQLTIKIRRAMKKNFHNILFDKKRKCYADASIDGKLSSKISEHGNMTPIWAGLCDRKISNQIISTVFESNRSPHFTEAQPFFMAIVLSALDKAGRFDLGLDLIQRRWGRRMVDKGATSVFEEWYQNGSWRKGTFLGFLRTHSHAWSAYPADFLIRHTLGLEIQDPGCRKIRVSPKNTDFDYKIIFPTPRGTVTATCTDGNVNVSAKGSVKIVNA